MMDIYQPATADTIIDEYHGHKKAMVDAILSDGGFSRLLTERAVGVPFRDESAGVMLVMAADLLAPHTDGRSRAELLEIGRAPFSTSESKIIGSLALQLGMIRSEIMSPSEIDAPNDGKVVIIEGGANITSIDRRTSGFTAIRNDPNQTVYQLGSGRLIPSIFPNGISNPEYGIVTTAAPNLLNLDEHHLSEYEVNLATAFAAGWSIDDSKTGKVYKKTQGTIEEAYALTQPGAPGIASLKPKPEPHGRATLRTGIAGVADLVDLAEKHVVIATTSHYAPASKLRAALELQQLGLTGTALSTVADTKLKSTKAYALEIAVLMRHFAKLD